MVSEGILTRHQYVYHEGLGTCDALLDIFCVGKAASDRGRELAAVLIIFQWRV